MALLVDTRDHRFTGNAADLTTYRDAKHTALSAQLGPYWMETSFGAVDVALTMRPEMLSLHGIFDDYFNRDYLPASLTTAGLSAGGWPRTFDGTATATLHIRDAHDRNKDVTFAPNGVFADAAQLAAALQTTFNDVPEVPSDWVTCNVNARTPRRLGRDAGGVADLLIPTLNAEFPWVEQFDAGADRVGLQLLGPWSGPHTSVRVAAESVAAASGLAKLGLDGPRRVDGVIRPRQRDDTRRRNRA